MITFPGSSSDDTSVPVCGDTVPLSQFVPGQDGKSPVVALLIAIPAVLALVLTGLWVTGTARSAGPYGQVGRLAALGQQVTGLARAMAVERSDTATFISGGRPAALRR